MEAWRDGGCTGMHGMVHGFVIFPCMQNHSQWCQGHQVGSCRSIHLVDVLALPDHAQHRFVLHLRDDSKTNLASLCLTVQHWCSSLHLNMKLMYGHQGTECGCDFYRVELCLGGRGRWPPVVRRETAGRRHPPITRQQQVGNEQSHMGMLDTVVSLNIVCMPSIICSR